MKKIFLTILVFALVASLVGCSTKTTPSGNGNLSKNVVHITNYSFQPESITINKGESVTWVNDDSVTHTVTSDTNLFDSGSISADGNFTYTFSQSGTFRYHCSIHSSMKGEVVVN
jgi:plastocyanin